MVSLFASKTFLLKYENLIVGSKPAMPTIAEIVISNLYLFKFISENLLKILTLLILFSFLIFLKTFISLIKKFGFIFFLICFLIRL